MGLASLAQLFLPSIFTYAQTFTRTAQGGNFHLKVGGAKSSGNAGDPSDPMLGFAVSGGSNHPNHKVGGGEVVKICASPKRPFFLGFHIIFSVLRAFPVQIGKCTSFPCLKCPPN